MAIAFRKLYTHASVLLTGGLATSALGFAQGLATTRALGPERYGTWGVIAAVGVTVQGFCSFRTDDPLTRYLAEYHEQADRDALRMLVGTALATDLATSLLSCLVTLALYPVAMRGASDVAGASIAYWLMAATLPLAFPNATWFAVVRGSHAFRKLATLPAVVAATQTAITLALWGLGRLDLVAVAAIALASVGLKFAISVTQIQQALTSTYGFGWREIDWAGGFRERARFARFWSFMGSTYLASMVSSIAKNADILVLRAFTSEADAGYFRLAKTLAQLVQSLAGALTTVIYQEVNEFVAAGQGAAIGGALRRLLRLWLPAVVGVTGTAALAAPLAIRLVFGAAYAGAVLPFQVLLVGTAATLAGFWAQPIVLAFDRFSFNLRVTIACCGLAVPVMFALTWAWGMLGLAASVSLMWIAVNLALALGVRAIVE